MIQHSRFYHCLLAILLAVLCCVPTRAYDFEDGGIYYYVLSERDKTCAVTHKPGEKVYTGCVNIPSTVQHDGTTYTVTAIGGNAFFGCAALTSVTIPSTVEKLGETAFGQCTGLTVVTVPGSVKTMGKGVFQECINLKSVVLEEGVEEIGGGMLTWCSSLETIVIPLTIRKSEPFLEETALLEAQPDGWVYVGNMLYGYKGDKDEVTGCDVEDGTVMICGEAFKNCRNMAAVTIPGSVKGVGRAAFSGCSSLVAVELPDGLAVVDEYSFSSCTSLASVTLPQGLAAIKAYAFSGCSNLASITIPKKVEAIDDYAFNGCEALATVHNYSTLTLEKGSKSNGGVARYASEIHQYSNHAGETIVLDGVHYLLNGDYTCMLTGCDEDVVSVEVPEGVVHDGRRYTVTTVGAAAFAGCMSLTSVKFLDSTVLLDFVLEGRRTFESCPLDYVYLGRDISYAANGELLSPFAYCCMTTLELGDNVTIIHDNEFLWCNCLLSVVIPPGVTGIGKESFAHNSSLTSVTIPGGVLTVGEMAFYGCYSIEKLSLPSSVWMVGAGAFAYCLGLKELVLCDGGDKILFGSNALRSCPIESLYVGREISDQLLYGYDYSPFFGMTSVTSLTIGEDMTRIPHHAFMDCSGLTTVKIPAAVRRIDDSAFEGCENLTTVYNMSCLDIKAGSKGNGHVAFYAQEVITPEGMVGRTYSVDGLYFEILAGNKCLVVRGEDKYCGDIVIPDEIKVMGLRYAVTGIGDRAFAECSGLSSVFIPTSVTSIGNSAFSACSGLASLDLPAGVTSIGAHALAGTALVTFTVPSGVRRLEDAVLMWCNALTCVTLPDGLESIGANAFAHCGMLASVRIPDGVKTLGYGAFSYCKGLVEADVPDGVETMGKAVFSNCENLVRASLPAGLKEIDDFMFEDCTSLVVANIPAGVTKIGDSAFKGCLALAHADLPEGLVTMGPRAFNGCSSLSTIGLPSSLALVPAEAFAHCTRVRSLSMGSGVEVIGDWAFEGCEMIDVLDIPAQVRSIGERAFAGCTYTQALTLHEGLESIGDYAFSGCAWLSSFTIPSTVNDLGAWAFTGTAWWADQPGDALVYHDGCLLGRKGKVGVDGHCEVEYGTRLICRGVNAKNGMWYDVTSVELPYSLRTIGARAFCGSRLRSITVPSTVESIGPGAFSYCSDLKTASIMCNVGAWSDYMFDGCGSLERLTVMCSTPPVCVESFGFTDDNYRDVTLVVPADAFRDYAQAGCWKDFGDMRAWCDLWLPLYEGWTWMSVGSDCTALDLLEPIRDKVERLVGHTQELVNDASFGLVGNLSSISHVQGYKIKVGANASLDFTGEVEVRDEVVLDLKKGWNWIAYPHFMTLPIACVVNGAQEGDCLSAQDGYATYEDGKWGGNIGELEPGMGYMYKSVADKPLRLCLQSPSPAMSRVHVKRRDDGLVCVHRYPNTMNVTARLHVDGEEAGCDSWVIHAVSGGEIRGVGHPCDSVYCITVHGDDAEKVEFLVHDLVTGSCRLANEKLAFTSDVVGCRKAPLAITVGDATSVGTSLAKGGAPNIYDMGGRQVKQGSRSSLPKGVYISGGRRFVVP